MYILLGLRRRSSPCLFRSKTGVGRLSATMDPDSAAVDDTTKMKKLTINIFKYT